MIDDASEQYLLERAREGYVPAFEVLVRRHTERLYAVAVRLLGDAGLAEDATQEAFLRAWTQLVSFRGESELGTWLTRIVINEALALQRRSTRSRSWTALEHVSGALGTAMAGSSAHGHGERRAVQAAVRAGTSPVAEQVEAQERTTALYQALGQLPDDLRVAVVLTSLVGTTYQEAAGILGISVTTLQGRVLRGRRQLTAQMRGWA